MKTSAKATIKEEIIGCETEITDSKNKSDAGIKGTIIDETKNTIVVEEKGEKKRLFKNNITLKIKIKDRTKKIEGKMLSGRSKERMKK